MRHDMRHEIMYEDMLEACYILFNSTLYPPPKNGDEVQDRILHDTDENSISEAERLNMILSVVKCEIEHDMLTDCLRDELYLYYEDYVNGKLDNVIADFEAELVIHDLKECFDKIYPDGLEDD